MATDRTTNSSFKTNASISEDWSNGYLLKVNLTAESMAEDWKLNFNLPYSIRETYGVDIVDNGDGSYTISGKNDQKTLQQGQSIEPIFVVEDGGQKAMMPEFNIQGSMMSESEMESEPTSETSDDAPSSMMSESETEETETSSDNNSVEQQSSNKTNIVADSTISEDWNGGYKLEVGLTAESMAENWESTFDLPYSIRETYGVDIVDNEDGSYTISGQNDQKTLQQGQSIESVFIVEDGGQEAMMPEFNHSDSMMPESEMESESETDSTMPKSETDQSETTPETDSMMPKSETDQPEATSDSTNNNEDIGINPEAPSQVIVEDPKGESVEQQGQFAYGEALQKNFLFYEANRSGDLGPYHRLEWRDDSTKKDGSTVGQDLEGGYFDAGDHVKFGQPMAASVNMLAWGGVEYREAYQQSGQFDELLEAVKWGTDYFLKAHEVNGDGETARLWIQVGEGQYDHKIWTAPSDLKGKTPRNAFAIDPGSPGSDVAASTAGALASASMLFRGVDDAYADKLLKNAEQLYEFAEKHQGKYSDSVDAANPYYTSYSGYYDELASGAAWLYKATDKKTYLTKAESYFKDNVGGLGDWSWAVDDHSYGAAVLLAQESDDPAFKTMTEDWLNKWVNGSENIQYTDGGFAFRAEWGSVPVTSSAAFLAELYNDTVKEDSRYSEFATSQVDYILGDNPRDYSYMIGFGDKYPESPHHRGSSPDLKGSPKEEQQNILYGAIVGGPDAADDYAHSDRRDDWVTNEVGTSYNAPFASALIQQYGQFGGDPLSQSELDALEGVDANGVGI